MLYINSSKAVKIVRNVVISYEIINNVVIAYEVDDNVINVAYQ